jgi:hypothetical protein
MRSLDEILVVQDFTCVEFSSSNRQVMCICLYTKEEEEIISRYITFVAKSSDDKNDIKFVVAAWIQMVLQGIFEPYKSIEIWSDGGPKHFKITASIVFFGTLQNYFNKKITYNFFTSYHGHSVCDTMASHMKRKLRTEMIKWDLFINTSEELLEIINKINGYENHIIDFEGVIQDTKCGTLHGIRRYHKFKFDEEKIYCFSLSEKKSADKEVSCHNF